MGRCRTVHLNLPRGMRARVRPSATYYYLDTPERDLPLGSDYLEAVKRWAELMGGNAPKQAAREVLTLRRVALKYAASPAFAAKAPRTQRDNIGAYRPGDADAEPAGELGALLRFFDKPPVPLDSIEPQHLARYRDWRKSTHSTQEIALFSAIWNWAREQGYTSKPNPCAGVKRNRGAGRDVFITDALFSQVYSLADQPTRDAMDLAYLAGQRPGDNLRMMESDIKREAPREDDPPGWDGRVLYVQQGKTGAKLRVRIIGKLADTIDRIQARKAATPGAVRCLALCVNEAGQPLSASALDGRFGKAREAAGVQPDAFQMRDLRAKAITEADDRAGRNAAQDLAGHTTGAMTNRYIRHRVGKLVNPSS